MQWNHRHSQLDDKMISHEDKPASEHSPVPQAAEGWVPIAWFNQSDLAVAWLDRKMVVRKASQGLAALLATNVTHLEGTLWTAWVAAQDREAVQAALAQVLADHGPSQVLESRYTAKSGDLHWCSTLALAARDSEGQPAKGLLLILLDATGKKQLEEDFKELEQQFLAAQKMESLGLLAGGMAHDFNNFLEVILGFASLARSRVSKESELYEPLQMIEESARRASELTSHLLNLVRESGEPGDAANPEEVLQRVVKIIRRTFDRSIQIETRLEPQLPWVRGDARSLEQAVLNLALNARDAMPEGGILRIAAARTTLTGQEMPGGFSLSPGDYVRMTVEDTGTGMESAVLKRIFDPLFTTKPAGEGTGLGLTVVQRIVQGCGGGIQVESVPEKGSSFILFLPVTPAPQRPAAPKPSVSLVRGRGTVLVVEDEPMVLAFVEKGLEQLGYTVLTASSGKEACELYARHANQIGCVLLDMIMPEMSGLETYARLKAIRSDVKVIMSSGYSRERLPEELAEADFLGKPYSLEALSRAIEKIRSR